MDEEQIKKGQRFRTRVEMEVLFLTSWYAPCTSGGRGKLAAGTVLVVDHDPMPQATGVACIPENYSEVERHLVSEKDRQTPRYSNFHLVMDLASLREECDRLSA